MNVIDALVVTLSLDSKGFTRGQAKARDDLNKTRVAAGKHTKQIELGAQKMGAAFKGAGLQLLGLLGIAVTFGAAVNQFKNFVVQVTGADAATGRAAKNMGVMTKELAAWQKLAPKFGSSEGDITGAFANAFRIGQELKWGGSAASGPLGMLLGDKLSAFTQLGQGGDVTGMIKMLQAAVANSSDQGSALKWMREAGFSDDTFTMFKELGKEVEKHIEIQKRNNAAGEDDARQAAERLAAWSRLTDALDKAARGLMNLWHLTELLDKFTLKLQSWIDGKSDPVTDAKNAIKNAVLPASIANRMPPGKLGLDTIAQAAAEEAWAPGVFNRWFGVKDKNARASSGGGDQSFKWGTEDFSKMLAADLRGGATFGPGVLDRLTNLARGGGAGSVGSSSTTNIETINVITQATNANGMAAGVRGALQRELSAQGNVGQR